MVPQLSYVDVMAPNSCAGLSNLFGTRQYRSTLGGDFFLAMCLLFSVGEHLPYRYGFSLQDTVGIEVQRA
jgi:hypothetical protein